MKLKFSPITNKYSFTNETLTKEFPEYMSDPITKWIYDIFDSNNLLMYPDFNVTVIDHSFIGEINILFREKFPDEFDNFIEFILAESERTAELLALLLQNYAYKIDAEKLESVLSRTGSAYEVTSKTDDTFLELNQGGFSISERVPKVVKEISEKPLSENDELKLAFEYCYSRSPDYQKVVQNCQNVLERLIRDSYFPNDKKAQLGKLIADLRNAPEKLSFKGENVLLDKLHILNLIENVPAFRGLHTAGTGKSPSKHDAEFILHTTILFWYLHQK